MAVSGCDTGNSSVTVTAGATGDTDPTQGGSATTTGGTGNTVTTDTGNATTGSPSTTTTGVDTSGPDGPLCEDATTPEQCAESVGPFREDNCQWVAYYTITPSKDSCEFEDAGGVCGEPDGMGTDCGSDNSAPCDQVIFGEDNGDGTYTIARAPDSCFYNPDLPELDCSDEAEGEDVPVGDPAICACGCSPDYPGE